MYWLTVELELAKRDIAQNKDLTESSSLDNISLYRLTIELKLAKKDIAQNKNLTEPSSLDNISLYRLTAELELAKRDIAQNKEDIMNMGGTKTKVRLMKENMGAGKYEIS